MTWHLALQVVCPAFLILFVLLVGMGSAWDAGKQSMASYGIAARNVLGWWPLVLVCLAVSPFVYPGEPVMGVLAMLLLCFAFFLAVYLVAALSIAAHHLRR